MRDGRIDHCQKLFLGLDIIVEDVGRDVNHLNSMSIEFLVLAFQALLYLKEPEGRQKLWRYLLEVVKPLYLIL